MRNLLIAAAAALTLISATAATASADDPYATTTTTANSARCTTPPKYGVYQQYGASGWYVDGCTARITCPARVAYCYARSSTYMKNSPYISSAVYENARLRLVEPDGRVSWFRDKSCHLLDYCSTSDEVYFNPGQTATIQCNGTRGYASEYRTKGVVSCGVEMFTY
jgi:hypothetical protein